MKLTKIIKLGDGIIIVLLLALLFISLMFTSRGATRATKAFIYIDGQKRHVLSLNQDQTRVITTEQGRVKLEVKAGRIWIKQSSCLHKTCMKMGKISGAGGTIICIPNRLIIEVKSDQSSDLDSVTM